MQSSFLKRDSSSFRAVRIPFDTQKPFVTSGIRIGTAATTTRGFVEEDMIEIGKLIGLTLKDFDNSKDEVMARVKALCEKHPLYE